MRATAKDVTRWAFELGRAGVSWVTVKQLGQVMRRGADDVVALGDGAVEGPDDVRSIVATVVVEVASTDAPGESMAKVADLLRRLSRNTEELVA